MVEQTFAFALLERNGLHPCLLAGYHRDDLPSGPIQHQGTQFAKEGQSLFPVVESVVDTAGMIPNDVEILVHVGSHQGVGCLHGVIRIGQLATTADYTGGQIGLHSFKGIVQQVYTPVGHQAAGIVPKETEIVVEAVGVEGTFRSRT